MTQLAGQLFSVTWDCMFWLTHVGMYTAKKTCLNSKVP